MLDIINPESTAFSRIALPSEFFQNNSIVRLISLSADARYISLAGSSGFAHLSTATGRWRSLDTFDKSSDITETAEDVPHVRGGMCWYGNILLIAGDFGEHHDVILSTLTLLKLGSSLSPQCIQHEFTLMASQRIVSFFHTLAVIDCRLAARLLPGQYIVSLLGRPLHRIRGLLHPSQTHSIWSDQLQGNHSFPYSSSCNLMGLT